MGQSTISSGVPLLACIVILARLINAANGNAEPNSQDGVTKEINTLPETRSVYAKDGFLAGVDTPVWFAEVNDRGEINYRRVPYRPTPVVQRAINYWNSLKKGPGFPIRKTRSVDYSENFTSSAEFDATRDARKDSFYSPRPVEKRSAAENRVLYPSILVIMDYHDVFSTADKNMDSFVEQLVLYALAFWSTVDSSLRNIKNPRVSLRIAGIIITDKRNASPYLTSNQGSQTFVNALTPMMDYWRSVSKNSEDFPIGSYHVVAHMTDIEPAELYTDWEANIRKSKPTRAVAVEGPPCKLTDEIAGLIVFDDFLFGGLHRTIAAMSKVLGGSDQSPRVYGWPRRTWTKEILDPISNALKDASCMSAPKEHHQPGTPVAPILAGELMPNAKQCEAADYDADGRTCWDTSVPLAPSPNNKRSDCQLFACPIRRPSGVNCARIGWTLDGSFCNAENTQICLDGQCVDKI